MGKFKFSTEYELRASAKIIYNYLSTATGLMQWFADEVTELEDGSINIVWDDLDHKARIASKKTNRLIKFVFPSVSNGKENYLEFRLETNELTQTTFLKVIDFSENEDEQDLQLLWDNLIDHLKEKVGG